MLAGRFEQPGIVEVAGQVELQHDGLRAERARPYAFVVTPGRNARLAERLAGRYDATVVRVADADALLDWCHERGLGLDERTVDDLLGPENASERIRSQRRRRRRDVLRVAAAVTLSGALLAAGLVFASGPPSGPVFGRTGRVTAPRCAKPAAPIAGHGRATAQAPPVRARC